MKKSRKELKKKAEFLSEKLKTVKDQALNNRQFSKASKKIYRD